MQMFPATALFRALESWLRQNSGIVGTEVAPLTSPALSAEPSQVTSQPSPQLGSSTGTNSLPGGSSVGYTSPPASTNQPVSTSKPPSLKVKVYWIIPAGQTASGQFESGLDGLLEKTHQFYAGQLDGKTFQIDGGVNKVQSSHSAAWFYGCDGGGECGYADKTWRGSYEGYIPGRVKSDLASRGINVDVPSSHSIVILAPGTFQFGTGSGYGLGNNSSGGIAINGEQKTAGALGLVSPEPWCEPVSSQNCINQVTGSFIHEVGHSFGLPHPDDANEKEASIMWSWWKYPDIGLVQREKDKLLSLPVIGDR